MAKVYLASCLNNSSEQVAIKKINLKDDLGEDLVELILTEIQGKNKRNNANYIRRNSS